MGSIEQRKWERIAVEQDIRVRRGEQEHTGRTSNLSLGGVGLHVELSPPPKIGERMRVMFDVPSLGKPLEAEAEVRWCSTADATWIGLQFVTGFRARETWALGRYLEGLKAQRQADV